MVRLIGFNSVKKKLWVMQHFSGRTFVSFRSVCSVMKCYATMYIYQSGKGLFSDCLVLFNACIEDSGITIQIANNMS